MSAINEFCEVKDDVAKALRESITEVLDPNQNGSIQAATQRGSDELNTILERLGQEDFTLIEYDDVAVRQLIEKITVASKDAITVRFKGGFEIRKDLNGN